MTTIASTQRSSLKAIAQRSIGALIILLLHGCNSGDVSTDPVDMPREEVTGTFSIVAVDPNTGVCGAAVASKYPAVGKVVPYVRAGVGAFCTQHWHNPDWAKPALDMLEQGKLPEQVLADLLRDDPRRDKRQLAIIDMTGRAANRNPAQADPSGIWWGAVSGRYYACQGNTLTGPEVVFAMAKAYEKTKGSLADRLMAALVAGDCAGGDHRGRLAVAPRSQNNALVGPVHSYSAARKWISGIISETPGRCRGIGWGRRSISGRP